MGRIIRLQYRSHCADCGAELEPGTIAAYYGRGRVYGREGCHGDATGAPHARPGVRRDLLRSLAWEGAEGGTTFACASPDGFRLEVMPMLSPEKTPGLLALTSGQHVDCRVVADELRDRVGLPLSPQAFEVLATSSAERVLVLAPWEELSRATALSLQDGVELDVMGIRDLSAEGVPHTLRCQHARQSDRLKALLRDALRGAPVPAPAPQLGSAGEPRIVWLNERVELDARAEVERIALQRRPRALVHGEQEVDEIPWDGRLYRVTWYLSDFGQVTGSVAA